MQQEKEKKIMKLANYRRSDGEEKKLLDIQTAMLRYCLGRDSVRRIAESAGAVVRIGNRILVNATKMDTFFDEVSGT